MIIRVLGSYDYGWKLQVGAGFVWSSRLMGYRGPVWAMKRWIAGSLQKQVQFRQRTKRDWCSRAARLAWKRAQLKKRCA